MTRKNQVESELTDEKETNRSKRTGRVESHWVRVESLKRRNTISVGSTREQMGIEM